MILQVGVEFFDLYRKLWWKHVGLSVKGTLVMDSPFKVICSIHVPLECDVCLRYADVIHYISNLQPWITRGMQYCKPDPSVCQSSDFWEWFRQIWMINQPRPDTRSVTDSIPNYTRIAFQEGFRSSFSDAVEMPCRSILLHWHALKDRNWSRRSNNTKHSKIAFHND